MKKNELELKIDKPISDAKNEDKLHFDTIYAKSIQDILDSNKKNMSFGIIGNYGSGKTSIIKLLEKRIDKKENEFIHISVWGYEPIEFVKKLLMKINKKTEKYNEEKLNEKLYLEKEEINEKNFSKNLSALENLGLILACYILICLLIAILSTYFLNFERDDLVKSFEFMSFFFPLILFYFAYKYGINTIGKKKISKPLEIGEFQKEFKKILEDNKKDLIIVIDDLDRCNYNMINKTLEQLNCLIKDPENGFNFKIKLIIPFSLTKYQEDKLEKVYKNDDNKKNMEEFDDISHQLNKFFDSFMILPIQSELSLYKIYKGGNK